MNITFERKPGTNSLSSTSFGPAFWFVIHYGLMYKPNITNTINSTDFFINLSFLIPCLECRFHYFKYMTKYKNDLAISSSSDKDLQLFFYNFHNNVNKRLNINEFVVIDDEYTIIKSYKSFLRKDSNITDLFYDVFWFVVFNGTLQYPLHPTNYVQDAMKSIIVNLGMLIPDKNIREHYNTCRLYTDLDFAVLSRENLFATWADIFSYLQVQSNVPLSFTSLQEFKNFYGYDTNGSNLIVTYRFN